MAHMARLCESAPLEGGPTFGERPEGLARGDKCGAEGVRPCLNF